MEDKDTLMGYVYSEAKLLENNGITFKLTRHYYYNKGDNVHSRSADIDILIKGNLDENSLKNINEQIKTNHDNKKQLVIYGYFFNDNDGLLKFESTDILTKG